MLVHARLYECPVHVCACEAAASHKCSMLRMEEVYPTTSTCKVMRPCEAELRNAAAYVALCMPSMCGPMHASTYGHICPMLLAERQASDAWVSIMHQCYNIGHAHARVMSICMSRSILVIIRVYRSMHILHVGSAENLNNHTSIRLSTTYSIWLTSHCVVQINFLPSTHLMLRIRSWLKPTCGASMQASYTMKASRRKLASLEVHSYECQEPCKLLLSALRLKFQPVKQRFAAATAIHSGGALHFLQSGLQSPANFQANGHVRPSVSC